MNSIQTCRALSALLLRAALGLASIGAILEPGLAALAATPPPYGIITNPGEDCSTRMNLNWHSDIASTNCFVTYTRKSDTAWAYAANASGTYVYRDTFNGIYSKNASGADFYEQAIFLDYGVTLTGLERDTDYMYKVSNGSGGYSAVHYFKTAGAAEFSFLWISDFHAYPPLSGRLADAVRAINAGLAVDPSVDFIFSTGDTTAWGGSYSFWTNWYTQPFVNNYMFANVLGNHDNMTRSDTHSSEYFRIVNNFPLNGYSGQAGVCYWFIYNNVLFLTFNNEAMYGDTAEQTAAQNWAASVIQSQAGHYQYIFIAEHYQWFDGRNGSTSWYANWKSFCDTYHVKLALSGNNHIYERTYPLYADHVATNGTVYMEAPSSDGERGVEAGTLTENTDKLAYTYSAHPTPGDSAIRTIGCVLVKVNSRGVYTKLVYLDDSLVAHVADDTGATLPPTFLVDGLSRLADAGNAVSLGVAVSGAPPLSYRWQFNGSNLAGATTDRLVFSAAQLTNAGNYLCVVTNAYGSLTSRVMSLTVYPGQGTLFLDTFDTNTASQWLLNRSSTDTRVTFNYDYSAMGIPSAPRSTGGTTRGLKMEANLTAGAVAAVSLSPTNGSFAGDYRLRFDLWMNANGPFPAGGTGSSQHATAGVGTAGNRVQWTGAGSTADGYWFAVDGEGQASDTSTTSGDFCAYAGTSLKASTSWTYQAGTNSTAKGNLDPYYVDAFPSGLAAPAVQHTNYAQQTGMCAQGTIGFAWHEVVVARRGSTVDWAINGIRVAAITNATFTASNVFIGYWDMFTSLSDNTNLTFAIIDNVRVEAQGTPPTITAQPQPRTVLQGANATFSVTAGGSAPLGYQWRFNGTGLSGASASAYTVANAQPTNAGSYTVVVTNTAGSITSAVVTLSVTLRPVITIPLPASIVVTQGAAVTLCVGATGTGTLSYQWRLNGATLSGATASCFTRNNVTTNDAGTYTVLVSDVNGSANGSTVLTTLVRPFIASQPQGQTNVVGTSANLTVAAGGTEPLGYRWQFNGNPFPPGTNSLLVFTAGNYSVVVSNFIGMVTSAVATVVFTDPPLALPGHFDAIRRLPNGSVELWMSGTPNTNYLLQWTSDWLTWCNLSTLYGLEGAFCAQVDCTTNLTQRFYRLRLAP